MSAPSPLERAADHPRPQRTRARWTDLGGSWGFAYDDGDVGLTEGWQENGAAFTRTITVPFPPESPASGVGDPSFHPVVWYRRTFAYTVAGGEGRGSQRRAFRRGAAGGAAPGERLLL